MHKWSFFLMGLMAGLIAVLAAALLMQGREPQAFAQGATVDNAGGGLVMGIGGSQTQMSDILWVLYKHPAGKRAGADPNSITTSKDERLTLCCYQVSNGARGMRLAAVRDISFDMDLIGWNNEKPFVQEIIAELKKTQLLEKQRDKKEEKMEKH